MAIADRIGEPRLRMFAYRAACVVLGNLDAPGWGRELDELVRLGVHTGDRWQEAISRNDLGQYLMDHDDLDGAERELAHGIAIASELAPTNSFALAVLHCTRVELKLGAGQSADALAGAQQAIGCLAMFDEPTPTCSA